MVGITLELQSWRAGPVSTSWQPGGASEASVRHPRSIALPAHKLPGNLHSSLTELLSAFGQLGVNACKLSPIHGQPLPFSKTCHTKRLQKKNNARCGNTPRPLLQQTDASAVSRIAARDCQQVFVACSLTCALSST